MATVLKRKSIEATRKPYPGHIAWYTLDGDRSDHPNRPLTLQARGEGARIYVTGAPYEFRSNLRQIGARYDGNRWWLEPTAGNIVRLLSWLTWWSVLVDETALELLNAWWSED